MLGQVLDSHFLGVPPNIPIYRILPLRRLEELLRERKITLARPTDWEDPWEVIPNRVQIVVRDTKPYRQVPLAKYVPPTFAQCWSATKESDGLWRAYSRVELSPDDRRNICPDAEGVRIQSSPDILLNLVSSKYPNLSESCFIGSVRYLPRTEIQREVAQRVREHYCEAFSTPRAMADILLLKRQEFEHEREVRLIVVSQDTNPPLRLQVAIDPGKVIEEITFDPRLTLYEQRERESLVRRLGYAGRISESELYTNFFLEISVDGLPDPPRRAGA
jgi:hypothetical protein